MYKHVLSDSCKTGTDSIMLRNVTAHLQHINSFMMLNLSRLVCFINEHQFAGINRMINVAGLTKITVVQNTYFLQYGHGGGAKHKNVTSLSGYVMLVNPHSRSTWAFHPELKPRLPPTPVCVRENHKTLWCIV